MKSLLSKAIVSRWFLMLGIYLLIPTGQLFAQDIQTGPPDRLSTTLAAEKIDSHVAGMSDEQVR
jgi:hypothetical protein